MTATTKNDRIFDKLSELSEGQAVIKSQIAGMQESLTANTKLLRGNGVPGGMVTDVILLKEAIAELKSLIPDELACRKEMKAVKVRVEDYPTYLWLLRNKTKSTLAITATVLFLGIVVVTSLVDHGMFAAFLSWAGVSPVLIKMFAGGS